MSSIGKIFVVLNLVLAAAFVGWAYNASTQSGDWKKKHDAAVELAGKTKQDLDAELSKVRAELNAAKEDVRSITSARDESKRNAERLQLEADDLRQKNAALGTAVTDIQTRLEGIDAAREKAHADSVKALAAQKDAEAARLAAIQAQQAAEEAQADAEAALLAAQNQIAALEREKTSLANELGSVNTSLASLVAATGTTLNDIQNTEDIEAAVLGVDESVAPGLVAINAGASKGVKRGHTFEIFSGSTYKGQIRIEFVHADMASGTIIRPVQGQKIAVGDGASTRL